MEIMYDNWQRLCIKIDIVMFDCAFYKILVFKCIKEETCWYVTFMFVGICVDKREPDVNNPCKSC